MGSSSQGWNRKSTGVSSVVLAGLLCGGISFGDESLLRLKQRELPPRHDKCQLCHTQKSRIFVKKANRTRLEHSEISPLHGRREMPCQMCHDINNHNYLLKTKRYPADFAHSSQVCAKCHGRRYRDWTRGLHGKRMGGWEQPKTQYACIDCHQAHSVSFPKAEAVSTPEITPNVIRKGGGP